MKKFSLITIVFIILIVFGIGSAFAVIGLPTANFSGNAQQAVCKVSICHPELVSGSRN